MKLLLIRRKFKLVKVIVLVFAVILFLHILREKISLHPEKSINKFARKILEDLEYNIQKEKSTEYFKLELLKPLSSKKPHYIEVTLASQCSSNHLDDIIIVNDRWRGPISLTVFSHVKDLPMTVVRIAYFWSCFPQLKENITLSIVFPKDSIIHNEMYAFIDAISVKCSSDIQNINVIKENNYENIDIPYPHNVLRNAAINASKTKFVFVTDIDMVPSENAAEQFSVFIKRALHYNPKEGIERTAYVVPSFEISSDKTIPKNKENLLELFTKSLVRPFYKEVCWKCQKHTDYNAWKDLPKIDSLKEGYEVEWKDPWEPFYIATKNLPLYDERFKQYGFNRISQVCEMHVAGYRFAVLNNLFLVHRGFKSIDKFHLSKDMEQQKNRLLFRKFKEELESKYPDSDLRC